MKFGPYAKKVLPPLLQNKENCTSLSAKKTFLIMGSKPGSVDRERGSVKITLLCTHLKLFYRNIGVYQWHLLTLYWSVEQKRLRNPVLDAIYVVLKRYFVNIQANLIQPDGVSYVSTLFPHLSHSNDVMTGFQKVVFSPCFHSTQSFHLIMKYIPLFKVMLL